MLSLSVSRARAYMVVQLVNVSRDVARASTELQTSVLGAEEAVSERFRQLHAMLHERETSLKRQLGA